MAANYAMAVKTARMTATRDHFANGTIEILDASNVVLAVFGLDAAGGTVTNDVWTLVLDASTVAASAGGTATQARVKNATGTSNLTGLTVGTTGANINLDTTTIASGQNVTLSSATVTHAA